MKGQSWLKYDDGFVSTVYVDCGIFRFNALVNVNSQWPPRAYPRDSDIWENMLSESPLWVKRSLS